MQPARRLDVVSRHGSMSLLLARRMFTQSMWVSQYGGEILALFNDSIYRKTLANVCLMLCDQNGSISCLHIGIPIKTKYYLTTKRQSQNLWRVRRTEQNNVCKKNYKITNLEQ